MALRARVQLVLALAAGLASLAGAAVVERQAATTAAAVPSGSIARHVDRDRLVRDLATLADPGLEGRATATPGGLRARAWIEAQLEAIGLRPAGTAGFLQPFRFTRQRARGPRPVSQAPLEDGAANIAGWLDGTVDAVRTIVVSAHYDHVGVRRGVVHPGADDNASGVAVLLAAARHFRANPPRHRLLVVAFDAEELDLQGSRAFVASPPAPLDRLALVVNLDMVSRSDRREIYAAGTHHTPSLLPILQDVQRRAPVTLRFGHDRAGSMAGGLADWTTQSDHGPFHEKGVPFVYFGVEDHADYHAPTDTVDKVDGGFFGDVADTVVEAIRALDRGIE
jgi:hypothetical protein